MIQGHRIPTLKSATSRGIINIVSKVVFRTF
jgi:hypothetical protein